MTCDGGFSSTVMELTSGLVVWRSQGVGVGEDLLFQSLACRVSHVYVPSVGFVRTSCLGLGFS